MLSRFPLLASPIKVHKTTFRNRIMATPTSLTWQDFAGAPNDASVFYYEDKARGGACSVTLSETTISRKCRASRGVGHYIYWNWDEDHMQYMDPGPQLTKVAEAIKRHGAVPSIQLHHAGDVTFPMLNNGLDPFGPNDFVRKDGVRVKGMTEDDMIFVAGEFAKAAARAKALGFGMVMIHGGHGWLLSQFQSPATNWRKDKYGGSVENRARFPLMVVKAVREAVGPHFPVEYRLSADEHLEGGVTADDAAEFCNILQDYVSIFHVSAGSYYTARQYTFPGSYQPRHTNAHLAAAVKKKVKVPVASVGAHLDPVIAERILEEGQADFIAMGRSIIADPEKPNKIFPNKIKDIRPCIRCNNCLGRKYEALNNCDINPTAGNEFWTLNTPSVKIQREVLVIGGGPGGMQAAITASERGHKVKLIEKSDSLGGMLKFSDLDDHKLDLREYKNWLIYQVGKHNIDVRLNTEATVELIEAEKPYAVIVAVGARPIVPKFEGMDKLPCMHAIDAYTNPDKVGEKVVVVGGGLVGCEVAIFMSTTLGKKVTLIEMLDQLAPDANIIHRDSMMEIFEPNVPYRLSTKCIGITEKGVKVVDKEGKEDLIEADTVVYAVGMEPYDDLAWSFKKAKGVSKFFVVGDCVAPTRVKDAVHGGYYAAIDII
ncbi:MAG: FAD-dependent oxidoreductase [Desulfitobacteriia bacterium]|jgi:2,4-dienoyl-CoA reductase-like NADH-dependent reductase (Old Yellow Enzyme family)/thioredoxin reductase